MRSPTGLLFVSLVAGVAACASDDDSKSSGRSGGAGGADVDASGVGGAGGVTGGAAGTGAGGTAGQGGTGGGGAGGAGGTSAGAGGAGASAGGASGSGGGGAAGSAGASLDAASDVQMDASADATACTPDEPCSTNAGAPCWLGRTVCGDAALCADDAPAADGTTCGSGLCAGGACLGATTISADTNLTTTPVTPGRSCAEAPQYAVASLTASGATLASVPFDCLAAGDEVLLVNLQGAPNATTSVGNWELLIVDEVDGSSVTFRTPKRRTYGDPDGTDLAIGPGIAQQKVALVRVPRFGALTIASGTTLTASAWDGFTGGVVALRAASLDVQGTISAAELGYRPGAWSTDSGCVDNVETEAGESITGLGAAGTLRNGGAPGGLGAASGISFNSNTPINPSAGHARAGEPGQNPNGRTLGEPGEAYGTNDGSKLTMGSGPSGNLTCGSSGSAMLMPGFDPAAGIVLLLAGDVTLGASGSITATAPDDVRDVAASGGTVFIRGATLTLGDALVTARGGTATSQNGVGPTGTNQASPGYVMLSATGTISGTTDPIANLVP